VTLTRVPENVSNVFRGSWKIYLVFEFWCSYSQNICRSSGHLLIVSL